MTKTAYKLGKVAKMFFCKVADDGTCPGLGPKLGKRGVVVVEIGSVVVVFVEFEQVVAGGKWV